jgi:hypothetical protein
MKTQRAYSRSTGKWIEVDTLPSTAKPSAKRQRLEGAFVLVPLKLAAEAFRANRAHKAFVLLWLLYLAWRSKSTVISIPNGELEHYGINRREKIKALRDYAEAGLIKVRQEGRRAVVVELLFANGYS